MSDFNSIVPIILTAFLLWLVGLTIIFYRLLHHYRKIAAKVSEGNLIDLIKKLLDSNEKSFKNIKSIEDDIKRIDKHLEKPIQKIGLKKYNPFSESGGDQSFSLCLLDENENGVVMTSLHTRDRTRIYVKEIKTGKSKLDLSKEEQLAVKSAVR